VVFRYPRDPSKSYIKRVIGVAGIAFVLTAGQVYVNGEALDEIRSARLRRPRVVSGDGRGAAALLSCCSEIIGRCRNEQPGFRPVIRAISTARRVRILADGQTGRGAVTCQIGIFILKRLGGQNMRSFAFWLLITSGILVAGGYCLSHATAPAQNQTAPPKWNSRLSQTPRQRKRKSQRPSRPRATARARSREASRRRRRQRQRQEEHCRRQ